MSWFSRDLSQSGHLLYKTHLFWKALVTRALETVYDKSGCSKPNVNQSIITGAPAARLCVELRI